MSTWTEIDERVLRWLLDQDSNPDWDGRVKLVVHGEPQPFRDLNGEIDSRQADEALTRLHSYALIAGVCTGTVMVAFWSGLRLAPRGLILLGEWHELAFHVQLADYSRELRQEGGGVTRAWVPGAAPDEWTGRV